MVDSFVTYPKRLTNHHSAKATFMGGPLGPNCQSSDWPNGIFGTSQLFLHFLVELCVCVRTTAGFQGKSFDGNLASPSVKKPKDLGMDLGIPAASVYGGFSTLKPLDRSYQVT